jgi:isocitrate lyase
MPTIGNYDRNTETARLEREWAEHPRWANIARTYGAGDVVRLRGSLKRDNILARRGAEKLWQLVNEGGRPDFRPDKDFVNAMGALTGGQAVQQVKAGIQAIYLSGWQVAADANSSETMYPDQSLYAVDSVPTVVRRINNAFERADQIQWKAGRQPGDAGYIDYFAPIVADAEAGFGGVLNAYELMKNMIRAGAAGVHFEDQLASVKKCGHMGGKVLVPTQEAIQKLIAARLAADVEDVPALILARTDANAADLLTSDCDPRDQPFVTGERTAEGFYRVRNGLDQAIARGLAYAPYADLLWCETARPDLAEARRFAEAIHREYPGQLLAYNCSPSFNWRKNLDDTTIARFQRELSAMGYKFQFITLAGIHDMWHGMFDLAYHYAREDMSAYVRLQEKEFADAERGYTFVAHQQEVGTGYFDDMTTVIQGGQSSVTALTGSTEEEQFQTVKVA